MSEPGSSHRRSLESSPVGDAPGSSSRHLNIGAEFPPLLDDEPTVISHNPPRLLQNAHHGFHPLELGRVLEGRRLGHFQLEEFIGGGGMGAVFRALDTMLNRIVAVKVLSTDQASDEETQRRFKNEAQSAARLDHENIARVYYVGEDRGLHYIVFEHIEGINLRDLVTREGPLKLEDAVSYAWQISKALIHASQRDVVHRDIKPSNVLITPEGRAKLVDMGLARLHKVEHTENDLTASGVTLGTFDYISPEQARDPRTADVRSDLYSLGCTLYFTLTGRPPFPEGTVLQKLLRHQGDPAPDPRDLRPELTPEISRITLKLLSKAPEDRYQDPSELIADFQILCDQLGLPVAEAQRPTTLGADSSNEIALAPRAPHWASTALARHLPWIAPIALLLVAVAVIDRVWMAPAEPMSFGTLLNAEEAPATTIDVRDAAVETPSIAPEGNEDSAPEGAKSSESPRGDSSGAKSSVPMPGAAKDSPAPMSVIPASGIPMSVIPSSGNSSAKHSPEKSGAKSEPRIADPAGTNSAAAENADDDATLFAQSFSSRSVGNVERSVDPSKQPANAETTSPSSAARADGPGDSPRRVEPLIVNPANPVGAFPSLQAACGAARNGDVIELRFDGNHLSRPLKLTNVSVTIRAGRGFQPRIVFQPGVNESNPALYPRSMLTLAGGDLTVSGIEFELVLPREVPSENWSLFETRGEQNLLLDHCVLTVKNAADDGTAYHQQVELFDVKSPLGGDMMAMHETAMKIKPVEIRLLNCIVRGEATLLRSSQMQSADLSWTNGLLAISERAFLLQSDQAASRDRCRLHVELQHVTLAARRGLMLAANSDDAPYVLAADFECRDSILLTSTDAVLLEQICVQPSAAAREMITWSGERNFYEGGSTFWKIGGVRQGQSPELMTWEAWSRHWQSRDDGYSIQSQHRAARFGQLPAASRPAHRAMPRDFALATDPTDNPALGSAKNGFDDAGQQFAQLPTPRDDP